MSEAKVHVEHFTDPGCPFAFSAEPQRVKAQWHFGDQVAWDTRMIVLSDSPDELEAKGFTTEKLQAGFTHLQHQHGMPITGERQARLAAARALRQARGRIQPSEFGMPGPGPGHFRPRRGRQVQGLHQRQGAGSGCLQIRPGLEQSAFRRKRCFALALWFDASLRFEMIPSNRKTL